MRITESQLRRIIREVISEDMNEGIFGDFVDTFGQEDYRNYKMILQLCDELVKNIKKDENFKDVNLTILQNGQLNGSLVLSVSNDDVRFDYRSVRPGDYEYNVSSSLEKDSFHKEYYLEIRLNSDSDSPQGLHNFTVRVPLKKGSKFLNRPDLSSARVSNIARNIKDSFLLTMQDNQLSAERRRSYEAEREREKRKKARRKQMGG